MLINEDLKTGNKVYLKNGKIGIVICNTESYGDFILLENQTISFENYIIEYSPLIKHKSLKELDIIKVEEIKSMANFMNLINFEYLKCRY